MTEGCLVKIIEPQVTKKGKTKYKITDITEIRFTDKDGDVVLSYPWNKKEEVQNDRNGCNG